MLPAYNFETIILKMIITGTHLFNFSLPSATLYGASAGALALFFTSGWKAEVRVLVIVSILKTTSRNKTKNLK
jgi:hypothetical protein